MPYHVVMQQIIQGDCLEVMRGYKDNQFDLVLTDPPYGKMWTRGKNAIGLVKHANETDKTIWDVKPNREVFDEMRRISKNQIIFGGNYFTDYLPPSNCWIVWDKLAELKLGDQIPFAHCELAWASFNTTVKKFTLRQQGFINDSKDERVHPTQKPLPLMRWCLSNYSKEGDAILDPFMGSGTTLRAAKDLGRDCIGIEINPDYVKVAEQRLKQEVLL